MWVLFGWIEKQENKSSDSVGEEGKVVYKPSKSGGRTTGIQQRLRNSTLRGGTTRPGKGRRRHNKNSCINTAGAAHSRLLAIGERWEDV